MIFLMILSLAMSSAFAMDTAPVTEYHFIQVGGYAEDSSIVTTIAFDKSNLGAKFTQGALEVCLHDAYFDPRKRKHRINLPLSKDGDIRLENIEDTHYLEEPEYKFTKESNGLIKLSLCEYHDTFQMWHEVQPLIKHDEDIVACKPGQKLSREIVEEWLSNYSGVPYAALLGFARYQLPNQAKPATRIFFKKCDNKDQYQHLFYGTLGEKTFHKFPGQVGNVEFKLKTLEDDPSRTYIFQYDLSDKYERGNYLLKSRKIWDFSERNPILLCVAGASNRCLSMSPDYLFFKEWDGCSRGKLVPNITSQKFRYLDQKLAPLAIKATQKLLASASSLE